MKTSSKNPKSIIDTSHMSKDKRDALELTENARDTAPPIPSYVSQLFMGEPDLYSLYPYPEQSKEDKEAGDQFLGKLRLVMDEYADPDEIDQSGEIPDTVIDQLRAIGAFGIKIPKEYGGLGLSQANYSRAAMLLGSRCGNITALLSAHQSIGLPQPLLQFGTEEQKRKYLPQVAAGAISAFALTETEAGSDPAKMSTTAVPVEDGESFLLNGEKLWCTNGTKAKYAIVMARTPAKRSLPGSRKRITAFIVDMDSPGVEVTHRCHFMGLRALYNGVIRFKDVKVPKENIVLAEGKGLKVALSTLNTGRLTLPAACAGLAKKCLEETRRWVNQRSQWGSRIGKHEAIAEKVARMAAHTFALESMVNMVAHLVDRKNVDIRMEAAMAKMWGTEVAWRIADDALQIRGGRGYETAQSQQERGERAVPVERFLRDARINTIFEGSSEIMRLFLAREALDPHLRKAGAVLDSRLPLWKRGIAAIKAGMFYALWYPARWLPELKDPPYQLYRPFEPYMRFVKKTSHRLARTLFHNMVRYGPALEKRQLTLSRIVEIGTELFVLTASVYHADRLIRKRNGPYKDPELEALVAYLYKDSTLNIQRLFNELSQNRDKETRTLNKQVLNEQLKELEKRP